MNSLILTKSQNKKKYVKYNTNKRGAFFENVKIPVNLTPKIGLNSNTIDLVYEKRFQDLEFINIDNNNNNNNDDTECDIINPFDFIDKVFNIKKHISNNVNTICNVFQPVFKNGKKTTGFGDFIRGSYFLIQFCEEYNFLCEFKISNHKIKYLLKNFENSHDLPAFITDEIIKNTDTNHKPLIDSSNTINNNTDYNISNDFFVFLESCPIFDNTIYINTIIYPNLNISSHHREKMMFLLEPATVMIEKINNALKNLNLNSYCYEVIHIRFGDEYFLNELKLMDNEKIKKIFYYLSNLNKTKNYLLLCDNNVLKKIIISKFQFFKAIFNEIVHTKDSDIEIDNLKNTMLDFYLMSYSTNITSFSVYKHGSGFSQWCAETYDIPYVCKYLN